MNIIPRGRYIFWCVSELVKHTRTCQAQYYHVKSEQEELSRERKTNAHTLGYACTSSDHPENTNIHHHQLLEFTMNDQPLERNSQQTNTPNE